MIYFRNAESGDLSALMNLEESWPENERATAAQLSSRINRYPQGFLITLDTDFPGEIIGSLSSCPIEYSPDHPEAISSWNKASNDGLLPENSGSIKTDTLYLVSSVVRESRRGGTIYKQQVLEFSKRAKAMGYKRILSGAIIPGYKTYCERNGPISAGRYVMMQRAGGPLDPFLRVLHKFNYRVPNEAHVISDYYPDEASLCYAALVVCELDGD